MSIPWHKAALVGVVAGFLSGLLGIGGGVIVVPGLVLLVGLNQYRAAATSVATIVASSAAALYALSGQGVVNWAAAGVVFIGSATGALIGAKVMHRVPEHHLAGMFAVVLAAASIRMWF